MKHFNILVSLLIFAASANAGQFFESDWSTQNGASHKHVEYLPERGASLKVAKNTSFSPNYLARKNGGKIEFMTSEYTKNFGTGPFQVSFLNDGITTSEAVESNSWRKSIYGADSLSRRRNPFPEEFILSFMNDRIVTLDSFVVYNGPAGDGDGPKSEMARFSLYGNTKVIGPDDLFSLETDGGGWSYKDATFEELTIDNVMGVGLFAKEQQSHKFVNNSWIQSKNAEYTINTNDPKWVRLNFVEPTQISSIYIASDDSANLHNQETDIYNLEIAVHTADKKEMLVYSNRSQKQADSDYVKGYSAFFEPVLATGVSFRFYTEEYVEWQRILIFKEPWDRFYGGTAGQKKQDYGPEVFRFSPNRMRYLRLSVESNYGSRNWLDIGEIEVYNGKPRNIASRDNNGILVDCKINPDSAHSADRVTDGKIMLAEEYTAPRPEGSDRENYIIIDFGENKSFDKVIHWNSPSGGPKSVALEYAFDQMRFSEFARFDLDYKGRPFPIRNELTFEPQIARYLKLSYDADSWSGFSMNIAEIEVLETVISYHLAGGVKSRIYSAKTPSIFSRMILNYEKINAIPPNSSIEVNFVSSTNAECIDNTHKTTFTFKSNLSDNKNIVFIPESHNGDIYFYFDVKMNTLDKSRTPIFHNIGVDYKNIDDIMAEAETLFLEANYKEAAQLINQIKTLDQSKESREKASRKLAEVKKSIKEWVEKEYQKAKELAEIEKFQDVIEICRRIDSRFPKNHIKKKIEIMISDANIGTEYIAAYKRYKRRKGHWKALEDIKSIINTYPETRWAEKAKDIIQKHQEQQMNLDFAKAQKEFDDEKYSNAISAFREFIDAYPYSTLKLKAKKRVKEAQDAIALDIFNKGIEYYNASDFFNARNKFKEIIEAKYLTYITKAREYLGYCNDKIIEGEYKLAKKMQRQGKYNKAIKAFQAIAENFPGTDWADNSLVQIKKTKGMIRNAYEARAQKVFDKAVAIFDAKKYVEAKAAFSSFVREYKSSSLIGMANDLKNESQVILMTVDIDAFVDKKQMGEAANIYVKLLEIDSGGKYAKRYTRMMSKKLKSIYNDARDFYRDGDYKKAYDLFKFVVEFFPNTEWADRSKSRMAQAKAKI